MNNKNIWKFYLRSFKGDFKELTLSICLTIFQPIILLPIVLLVRYTFDNIIPSKDINRVVLVGILIVVLYVISNGISLISQYITLKTVKTAILKLRQQILKKFYIYPRSYYGNTDRIKLHTVIVQDSQRVDIESNALISLLLPSVIISIALCAILLFLDWRLLLIMMIIAPIILIFSRTIGKKIKKWTNRSHRLFESFSKGMFFVLQMMDLTKIRSAEQYEINRQLKIIKLCYQFINIY